MPSVRCALIISLILLSGCATSVSNEQKAIAVQSRERQWLDAYEQRDAGAMSAILHDNFVITYPGGKRQTKDQVLQFIRTHAAEKDGPRFHTEHSVAHVAKNTVVLTGLVITEKGWLARGADLHGHLGRRGRDVAGTGFATVRCAAYGVALAY